jgi:signal transduction histidine kinase/CheY-like chemotaxis protein
LPLLTDSDYPDYFAWLLRERAIVAMDACRHPATHEFRDHYLVPQGITSMLDVPIRHHGRMIGIICAEHRGPLRDWTPEDVAFAGALADLIGRAINARSSRLAQEALAELNHNLERKVSERTAELESARQRIEAASRAKSVFLANMSHELRTPFNGIMGMIALASKRMTDPKGLQQLKTALRSSEHLLGVINDILDLSKIEAERLLLESSPFCLRQVFDHVLGVVCSAASDKGLSLDLQLPAELAARQLVGDPLRLGQVLINLLGNAVKFSHAGMIRVAVLPLSEKDGEIRLRFEVEDHGIGIAPEDQARLFTAFEQADSSTTRHYGGTGLGLAISKRLVALMRGEIGVESVPGHGSTFWFDVWVKGAVRAVPTQGQNPVPTESPDAALQREFAGCRLLFAEDEPISQEVVRDLLTDVGLAIDLAADGGEALSLARQRRYALILMDMQMPRLNGVDAARAIRADSLNTATPILAMTANAFESDRQSCLAAGMNDHIAKPVAPDLLFENVLKWLRSSGAGKS